MTEQTPREKKQKRAKSKKSVQPSKPVLPGYENGLTIRDYFAAQALAGGVAEFFRAGDAWEDYDDFAASCYTMADALMAERDQ